MIVAPHGTRPQLRVIAAASAHDTAHARRVDVVAHAGLGIHRPGGAPTRTTLRRAIRLGADLVEVDVCSTLDQELVLRHDTRLASGAAVARMTLRQLRARDTSVLTLDEARETLGGARLVLDLKGSEVVAPLGAWLRARPEADVVVCTEQVGALRRLRRVAPETRMWQTFPDVGQHAHQRVGRVVAGLLAHRGRDAVRVAADIAVALSRVHMGPGDAMGRLAGVPWRRLLPRLMGAVRDDLGACGIAVHRALVTGELCSAAHDVGLSVTAWTVNEREEAIRAVRCGVDMVTTDDIDAVRHAVPRRPRLLAARGARIAAAR